MPVYLVERSLPGAQVEHIAAAQKRAIEDGKALTAEGKSVRYIRSTFIPGEQTCMCLFEAATADLVREANERAEVPFTRIVEAVDLSL